MEAFEKTWPDGLQATIHYVVKHMSFFMYSCELNKAKLHDRETSKLEEGARKIENGQG